MSWTSIFRNAATDWRFANQSGIEITAGEAINFGAGVNRIYLKHRTGFGLARFDIPFAGAGVGVGFLPADVTTDLPSFPSYLGKIYRGLRPSVRGVLGGDLVEADFEGYCTMVCYSKGGFGLGMSTLLFFFGTAAPSHLSVVFGPVGSLMALSVLLGVSRAFGMCSGFNRSANPGMSVMVYNGFAKFMA